MDYNLESIQYELDDIEQEIIKSFVFLERVDLQEYPGCKAIAKIEIEVFGEAAVLTVGFPKNFPNELPKFYDKNNHFGSIPHKMSNGFLCFTRSDSLIIDIRYPASILLNCLEKVIVLIEAGIKGENKSDYMDEFEAYWQQIGPPLNIYAHIDTSNTKLRELDLWWYRKQSDYDYSIIIGAEKFQSIEKAIKGIFHIDVKNSNKYRCIYFPLNEGTVISPPVDGEVWGFSELKNNIISNLSEGNKKLFFQIVNRSCKDYRSAFEFIIIGIPSSDNNVSLIGGAMNGNTFNLKSPKNKNKYRKLLHPFVSKPKDVKIFGASIERWHLSFMLNRTGGQTELIDKHVMIAGVGSVGSEVALRFAKAGVKKLTLIDNDTMKLENIHRHALGSDQVFWLGEKDILNVPKVWGVMAEINRKYPFTEVETHYNDIFSVLDEIDINKANIDLIVIAIGAVNKEMMINKKFMKLSDPPPTMYTWVEPLGLGGHTLITLNNKKKGCYQCLFKADEDSPIYNRSAFALPFQEFAKSITGCGSAFTPYNFLDSERSAMLTVESGIKVLIGDLQGNPLLSWKGNDKLFKKQGYKTSIRYSFTEDELNAGKYLYKDSKCTVCSQEGSDMY